jgi:hypothetical protein
MNAQETVKMFGKAAEVMEKGAAVKPPAALPKAPALMGFALVSSPKGYDFQLIVPSNVGPVFEKGLAPLGDGQ